MYEAIIEKNREYIQTYKVYRQYAGMTQDIVDILNTSQLCTLRGLKHTGKTGLIHEFLKQTKHLETAFYFNGYLDSLGTIKNRKELITLFDVFVRIYGVPKIIVLQDVHMIEDIQRFILELYKTKKYKILVVGNNIKIEGVKNVDLYTLPSDSTHPYKNLYGGIPRVRVIPENSYKDFLLDTLSNDIITSDILRPYNIKNIDLYYHTLAFIAENDSYLSQRELQRQLEAHHIDISLITLGEYLNASLNNYLLSKCERYDIKLGKAISTQVKYYFGDVWVRRALWNPSMDMTENLVYLDILQKWYDVYGGQNGRFQFSFYAMKWKQRIAIAFDDSGDKNEVRKTARKLAKIWDTSKKYVIVRDKTVLNMRKFEEEWVNIITYWELKI